MSTAVHRPQELICAVAHGAAPILEVWFVGGRGSKREPLLVEVLGTVEHYESVVCETLQQLMRRHGPWLFLDLSRVAPTDGGGRRVLEVLERAARRRGGHVSCAPAFDGGEQDDCPRQQGH